MGKYDDLIFKLNSMPVLFELFPNMKEWHESCAIFQAIWHQTQLDPKYGVVIVGDGHSPRTGAMVACRSPMKVLSVDPEMRERSYNHIKRLSVLRAKIEDIDVTQYFDTPYIVFALPHSHADKALEWETIKRKYNQVLVISMPCCVPDEKFLGGHGILVESKQDMDAKTYHNLINVYKIK